MYYQLEYAYGPVIEGTFPQSQKFISEITVDASNHIYGKQKASFQKMYTFPIQFFIPKQNIPTCYRLLP